MVILFVGMFFLFNWLMGYRKGHIQIDLDERYFNHKEYIKAIQGELEKRGYQAEYLGNHEFEIDGKSFLFLERNVSMGGVPLQRTILKPNKNEREENLNEQHRNGS
ncbi:hypothetical protein LCL89_02200 [Halobacillus yeomjeoni]|uniref:hypothetical protein n=1 Tax=Halobacillus yeomjeoni TaxID=311194 RepID=UPI001CD2992F|nr:hypothetical protein [Halobacillus yeomjeoni]MCA0982851.1 hypothetical protein [Halobacillus yeomjeoni]